MKLTKTAALALSYLIENETDEEWNTGWSETASRAAEEVGTDSTPAEVAAELKAFVKTLA